MYNINLIPWRQQRFKKIMLLAIIINLFLWLILWGGYLFYKNHLDIPRKTQQLRTLEQNITAAQQTVSQLKILAQAKGMLEKEKLNNMGLLDTLVQISKITPNRVQLDSIAMTPEEMTLIGQAANQTEMTRFSQAVFNLQYFNKQKSWTISERATDVDFKLVLKHENEDNNSF